MGWDRLSYVAHAVLAALSLMAGILVGISGCGFPCNWNEPESVQRAELVGGMVEISADTM
jgi:hypothetical protein